MPFKVKDLLVDVTSVAGTIQQCHPTLICKLGCTIQAFSGCFQFCTYPFQSICHLGCTNHIPSICYTGSHFTVTCGATWQTDPIIQATPQLSGPVLATLKEQLKQALDVAEKQTVAENEAMQPQTVADVEMLEKKLGEALEELRARKAELNKKK